MWSISINEPNDARRKSLQKPFRWIAVLFIGFTLLNACGSKPFNVKSRVMTPAAKVSPEISSPGLTIEASVIKDEDMLIETFDANLIMARLLPVSVVIFNGTQAPIDLKKAVFEIRKPSGRMLKPLRPQKAFKRLISFYKISSYNVNGYNEAKSAFLSHGLELDTLLEPGERREGLVFYYNQAAETGAGTYMLTAHGIRTEGHNYPNIDIGLK